MRRSDLAMRKEETMALIASCRFAVLSLIDPDGKPYGVPLDAGPGPDLSNENRNRFGQARNIKDMIISTSKRYFLRYKKGAASLP